MPFNGNEIAQRAARLVRKLRDGVKTFVWPRLKTAYRFCYSVSYLTGMQTVRMVRFVGKRLVRLLAPIGRLLYKALDFLALRHFRAIGAEAVRFVKGFPLAVRRVKEAFHRHPAHALGQILLLPFLALRRHRRALTGILNLAAPVAAAFLLVSTINYWSHQTFALALEYDGQTLGYIADESVFDEAAEHGDRAGYQYRQFLRGAAHPENDAGCGLPVRNYGRSGGLRYDPSLLQRFDCRGLRPVCRR